MVKLKARKLRTYNQRSLHAGQKFEASDKDAKVLLLAAGLVEPDDEDESPEEMYERPKRHYKRRDLTAE